MSTRRSHVCRYIFGTLAAHPPRSPNITPSKEGGKGHEIHGAEPCMNPYEGYKGALARDCTEGEYERYREM